jgi:hypothetical protein
VFSQAHYIKASALSKANRNDEALKEYFMCVALKPDWMMVKLEAQKVIHNFSPFQFTIPVEASSKM